MADVPAQLDYAQPLGWRQRKGLRRAIFAAALLLLIFGSLKFLRPAWDHVRLLHYQRQCLTQSEAAKTIAYAFDAARPKSDSCWERFYALFSPPGGVHGKTVFVHELHRSDGSPRLVAIEVGLPIEIVSGGVLIPIFPLQIDSTVLVPGGVLSHPQLRSSGSWTTPFDPRNNAALRLHAGQLDPANPAHFTIGFEYPDHSGTIDGWLKDDDTVLFELRQPLSTGN